MIAHVLAGAGLALYAFEVYRTILRFGVKRPGMLGTVAGLAGVHVFMAVALTVLAWAFAPNLPGVPAYVAPVITAVNAVYLLAALLYIRSRGRRRP